MTTPLIEAREVSREFSTTTGLLRKSRTNRVVDGVNLSVKKNEVVAIVGESGCGKSTLAQMLLGLLQPTQGQVLINGTPLGKLHRKEIAKHVQPVFQDPYASLNPRASIESSLLLPLAVHQIGDRAERAARVDEMLDAVGLARRYKHSYPAQLSGGQRQRVAIARALIIRPQLLICDEPTSALDVSVQSQVLNLLLDLRDEYDLNYILISHNLAVVEHMSTRVCVMYKGCFVEEGPTPEVFLNPKQEYTRMLLDSVLTPDPRVGVRRQRDEAAYLVAV
ncbi:MAG: ATP-binding cassette domain-containing protein [Pusillimonas sp.]